jgi:predicted HTH transcriptional regulator
MTQEEKIRACYFHCCLKHVAHQKMTNATLRERLKIGEKNYPLVSKIISDTIEKGLIKAGDPENKSKKYSFYIPFWA